MTMHCRHCWTVSADGASLAYWDEGQGPAVILTNGYANSTLYWGPVRHHLRSHYRVIRWDLRGHGRSGPVRDPETMTVAGCADDMRRVMDAAGVDRAVVAGFSFGSQIVLEAWRQFPERIAGLASVLGPYERPFDTLIHPRIGPLIFEIYQRVPAQLWGLGLKCGALTHFLGPVHALAQQMRFIGSDVSLEEMKPFYTHLATLDIPSWYAMGLAAQRHSARDLLEDIDVPTLVVAGGRDRFSPGRLGRKMAQIIPTAELVWLDEATHTGLFGARESIAEAMEDFVRRTYATKAYPVAEDGDETVEVTE